MVLRKTGKSKTKPCPEKDFVETEFSHICKTEKKKKITSAMKDAFGEVISFMVMKAPEDALNSTLKITENDRKIHKHSS